MQPCISTNRVTADMYVRNCALHKLLSPILSVVLQPIRIKETGVIAELAVFTLSVVSNFHFFSFSAILLNLIVKLRTLLLHIALRFT